jgi:hypothetical protein
MPEWREPIRSLRRSPIKGRGFLTRRFWPETFASETVMRSECDLSDARISPEAFLLAHVHPLCYIDA